MIHHQLRYINKLCFLHLCWSTQLAGLQFISFLTICICVCSHGHRLKKWTMLPLQLQVQGTMSGLGFWFQFVLLFCTKSLIHAFSLFNSKSSCNTHGATRVLFSNPVKRNQNQDADQLNLGLLLFCLLFPVYTHLSLMYLNFFLLC